MNNISFQGRTDFLISPTAYQKVEKTTRNAYTNLYKNSDCKLFKSKVCALKTEPEYLTVIMKNEDDGFFKFVPLNEDAEEVLSEISSRMDKLKRTARKENLTAWIVGGTKLDSPLGSKVVTTLKQIADLICDRPDIDTSILVGSNTGEEIFVVRSGVNQLKLALDRKMNPGKIEQELENAFDIVELNNTNLSYMA